MATKLINGNFSQISDALDQVLKSMQSEGADQFKDGIWRMRSRVRYNNTNYNIFYPYNGYINYSVINTGKITMITSKDTIISSDLRVNPLCDFSTGTFDIDNLVGWCGHSKAVDASDDKAGRIYITTEENEDTDILSNIKTVIFDAGKAIGTCKNVLETVDVRADIRSGYCAFQEYALETDTSGVPLTMYGFHSGIDGLTGEYEVILSNDSVHCQAIKNIKNGKLTYIDTTDARYNLVPSCFNGSVSLGDYIYYIGCNGYIYKVNKSTFAVEAKSSSTYTNNISSEYKINLFTDGTDLYFSSNTDSSSSNGYYYKIDISTLEKTGSNISYSNMNIPNYLKYNDTYTSYIKIFSIDNGNKFVLYSYYYSMAVVFTDLSDVANSILPEYTQFLVGGDSFVLTSDGLYSYWIYSNNTYNGDSKYDLGSDANYSLKICKNTSGQVFASAQWETPYENTGAKQLTLNMYDKQIDVPSTFYNKVTFISDGSTYAEKYVENGGTVENAGSPSMSNSKTFKYWCLDLSKPVAFNFNTVIKDNLVLYAYGERAGVSF